MSKYKSFAWHTLILLLMTYTNTTFADSFRTLLMPGEVINGHSKFEKQCDTCHSTFSKSEQGALCVKCHDHKNIANDISNKKGFHGKLGKSSQKNCQHCHTDHKGRNTNIVLLNKATFNHKQTDFQLKGAHRKTACNACHKPKKEYHQAPVKCYSCHKKDDAHKTKLGKKCETCHSESSWKKTAFDHNKTDFPLKGAHKKTVCAACHTNQKYKDISTKCVSCHLLNDAHRGQYGKKCESCHTEKKWTHIVFDHDKNTDFKLRGKHKKTQCTSCHTGHLFKQKLKTSCNSCHKNDDTHKGRNGKKCDSCHNTSSWSRTKFDHSKNTDFPLRGKHKKLSCTTCHKGDLHKDKLKTTCYSCHKHNDIHKGKQGKTCNRCHNEQGWSNNVKFDHDLGKFPLIGMHAAIDCEECHVSTVFSDVDNTCTACHSGDDVHDTRFGNKCALCHNPNSWKTWIFDHESQTGFKLEGAHSEAGCYDCHKEQFLGGSSISANCISCHRTDDKHNNQFGKQCGRCHNTNSFKETSLP